MQTNCAKSLTGRIYSVTKELDEIAQDEIAARLIIRHIGRINEAWISIQAINRSFPSAQVGANWTTFYKMASQMTELERKETPDGH